MNNLFLTLYVKLQSLMNREEGQDLVEYALLVALIALVCVASINGVASAIKTVFSNISSSLA
jgi:pilus assembly protein Flp/PilA